MFSYSYEESLSDEKVEKKARDFGMHFQDECKVFFGKDDE